METEKKSTNYPRKIARIILKVVLFLFLFVVLVFLLVLTPPVQHFLTGKVQSYLGNKLKTKVQIGSISFGLSGNINLENVYIEDKTKDTLISGGAIKAHVNLMKLFSNEIQVKDVELQNITTKIKRVLPDTAFNFQFIVDAFATEQTKNPDTATSAPMKLDVSDITFDNVNVTYKDVITGNDLFAHVGNLSATIDSLDPYLPRVNLPTFIARNVQIRMNQTKPLVTPEPLSKDMADAATPTTMRFNFGTIDLSKISVQYGNDVSAMYTTANIGQLKVTGKQLDLQNNNIYLDQIALNHSKIVVRMGKSQAAKEVTQQAKQEVAAQKTVGWRFRVDKIRLDNNAIQFDNDNNPRLAYGMDYSHILADSLTLDADNFLMSPDSTGLTITRGKMREKSGFRLEELQGDILYASNQTYLKNLSIKTPGTSIKRSLVLDYPSLEALTKDPSKATFDVQLVDSRIQVKDILVFAPQLRNNPALRNPNDVWNLNFVGNGSLSRLNIEDLRFNGLSNTQVSAKGTLVNLTNPKLAGGNFTIYRFHTTQTDMALFTGGKKLSNQQMTLPEDFTLSGTIIGNSGKLNTNLNMVTSEGNVALRGSFSNLTDPNRITYNATLSARSIQLGKILHQQGQLGNVTAHFAFAGRGATPNTINTTFNGTVNDLTYNNYRYNNVQLKGYLRQTAFSATMIANDPNLDLDLTASGNMTSNPSFKINGMIDSVKTLPLHLTTQDIIFRGKIDATVSNLTADNPDADILISKMLFVSDGSRLPLDTLQILAGKTDTANYVTLKSDIANATLTGQYRLADLGSIIQTTLQPYFSTAAPATVAQVKPYDFRFTADVVNSPVLKSFLPDLTSMEPIHAEGRFATGQGMTANISTPSIIYGTNEISKLKVSAYTADSGLHVSGVVAHLKTGSSFDIYNARVNATALHNIIDFNLGLDDQNAKNKYYLAGSFAQPSTGTYQVRLRPDSLLLNYQRWIVPADNMITVSPTNITANDFVLSQGPQRLGIASLPGAAPQPLQVSFTDFKLATLTGFVKADSTLVDGTMNGVVTFTNLLQHPLFTSDLTINDLAMKKDTLGNLNLKVNNDNNRYNANVTLKGINNGNDVAITGYAEPSGNDINLNLDLAVRRLELHTLEGATASAITNASGAITGGVQIRGSASKPAINGDLNFNKASFALAQLGSQFNIDNEKISVTENGLVFDKFTIRDSANNALTIDGNILTSNFVNYNFNLDVTAQNFEVLNSTKGPNKLYYGRLNINTRLHIAGTEVKPVVDGSLAVNDNTNLTIVVPQSEPGVQEREGIVKFVDMDNPGSDTLFLSKDTMSRANTLGMDITTNITISKAAIFNVIVDQANGDFLNIRGDAQLSAGIDPSGKITMVGKYTVEEGAYQLSFNFLQRRFDIQKGSTIVWTGDPTLAQLNLTAIYVANTAPIDLVQDQIAGSTPAIRNTYMQKLPFEVHLTLTGELMKPNIGFDILLPEDKNYGVSNDIVTGVQTRLTQLRQDQGEINKQVFSLLLLGRFVGQNPFQSAGGGGGLDVGAYARQSVSKLLTEQLNQLAGNLINGVDLNFDVASSDDYTTGERRNRTDLNVGLSKRLLNERLKVSVGSNFMLEGPQNSNQQSSNIAGNLAADYQLSRDGRYVLRVYRRNQYEGVVDGYIIETGVGFIMSVDYNRFTEILHRKKQRITSSGTNQNQSGQ